MRCFCAAFFWANLLTRFGGDCGNRFGAFCLAVSFGLAFGGGGGCAISGFSFSFDVGFCGRVSAFGSSAFEAGFTDNFGVGGLALVGGGGGGGGGGFFDRVAFCSFFAVLGLSPLVRFVVGTDCTICNTTIGCSSGRSRFIDGRPTHAKRTTLMCNPSEIISDRRSISNVPRGVSLVSHY